MLDDVHDEGEETMTLTDGEATGTIKNHDPLPRALLARFGRTAAAHVVERVEERLQAEPWAAGLNGSGLFRMAFGGEDVLTGSGFALNRQIRQGGILSVWNRGPRSRFTEREGALSLGGDVRTTMLGADYAKGPLVAGLSLSHSRGLGEYARVTGGQVASSVTGLYPWLGYRATERVTVWGVCGGTGPARCC